MDHQFEDIRTRPDGSIDTAYYIARSRMMRSEQAHSLGRSAAAAPAGWLRRLILRPFGFARTA
ncbi:hypothetical protein ATO6_10440 [Oceanicola sp. 22II-s10i]|uniref:hypothetical protein n=1 Tax=Oceanicola sp. 22II-s10i TaxID=1317116 RepID=UPI000B51EB32|nr:hypothetical protein [Oceanicola sp. 22II-s10i]OWU84745.1 hypothetical protein ATO6_10440 [Oceanicola sp. 22II-s10i]